MVSQNISRSADTRSLIASLCVAVVFVAMRTGARWFKIRKIPLQAEDLCIYGALVSFILTCALYLATIPTLFNITAIQLGRMEPYPSLEADLVVMLKEFFVVQFFFWLTLWAVKWSLLFMFRRITEGLQHYNQIWWGVFTFSILTFIGCCISNFTSCSSMHAWFTAGLCNTPRDTRAKNISLWFALGSDVITDLLIMAVPIRVLWTLRISLVEKISLGFIFIVGIITMVIAIVRSVSLESSSGGGQVSTTWLILWAGVEGAVAIVVGCLPSFAIFIRGRVSASRAQYEGSSGINPPGYHHSSAANARGRGGSARSQGGDPPWESQDTASNKSLVDSSIVVTQSWTQKWHRGSAQGTDIDREHELELINRG